MEKQKRKLEEDRLANARIVKENQSLLDSCEELERKRQKTEHDLQTKEAYIACLEGQLSHSKQAVEAEIAKVVINFSFVYLSINTYDYLDSAQASLLFCTPVNVERRVM
jgi:hypothetical protein